ncbi:MAG: M4 family metallopeptidase [Alphaproteobacteria bacterium]|nr:M4 family metallopeptidase [Alphaproteobacteria bacterium]
MNRSLVLLALFAAGCGNTTPEEAPDPLPPTPSATNLFPTGSRAEMDVAEGLVAQFLSESPDKLASVGGLTVEKTVIDGLSTAHVRMTQDFEGTPVFGGQLFVHLHPDGTVRGSTDKLFRDIAPVNSVLYDESEAVDAAVDAAGGWQAATDTPQAKLFVYEHRGSMYYAYRVRIRQMSPTDPHIPVVFVDAGTNEPLFQYDDLQTTDGTANTTYNGSISFPVTTSTGGWRLVGGGVGTYDLRNNVEYSDCTPPPGTQCYGTTFFDLESDEYSAGPDTVAFPDPDDTGEDDSGPDAHFGVLATMDYYLTDHGRDGMDEAGGPTFGPDGVISAMVHYGSNYGNAFWDGEVMAFGDGDGSFFGPLTSLDITAHELTHGVTEYSADLIYTYESGALNESMSDVFAVLVEAHVEGENPSIWEIGEDVTTPGTPGDALRYMYDPAQDGASTGHYDDRWQDLSDLLATFGTSDNGGVHLNSGISNLAFYLASEGGTHPDAGHANLTVNGIGLDRASAIWYRALTTYLGQLSGFSDARYATVQAAEDLYGVGSFEADSIGDAWTEVGVLGNDLEGGPFTNTSSGSNTRWTYGTFTVPSDVTTMRVVTYGGFGAGSSLGDLDLYVRRVGQPSLTTYDCRSWNYGNAEECIFTSPTPGTWNFGLYRFDKYLFATLEVTFEYGCNPLLTEITGNDFDEDCDGYDAPCGTETTGSCTPDLAITEILANPVSSNDDDGEWIEIQNQGAQTIDLRNATLTTNSGSYVVDEHVVIAPGAYAILASSEDPLRNGGLPYADDDFTGLNLGDTADTVTLTGTDAVVLDSVSYTAANSTGAAMPDGASISVDPDFANATDNDTPTYWCDGRASFGDGDFGTPRAANEDCDFSFAFDFMYDLDNGDDDLVQDDAVGTTDVAFWFDGTGRGFTTGNGGEGVFERETTSGGQSLTLWYDSTFVEYEATRAFGTDCFAGGTMTNLPANAISGSWGVPACP